MQKSTPKRPTDPGFDRCTARRRDNTSRWFDSCSIPVLDWTHANEASPLSAALLGDEALVRALLEASADPELRNDENCTAGELAREKGLADFGLS